jgi:hypothetical protein
MLASRNNQSPLGKAAWTAFGSGQGALEFIIIAVPLLILLMGVIDFGRALNDSQIMVGLSRDGSNMASRGETLPNSVKAVIAGDAPLDLSRNGAVIITAVTNLKAAAVITGQASSGGITGVSKVGPGIGAIANLPPAAAAMLQPGLTIYVTEVFYTYKPLTPIGNLMKLAMPSTLYQAAYF